MSEQKQHQVVIIGAGPAGWTAALYCARADMSPIVCEGALGDRLATSGAVAMLAEEGGAGVDITPGGQLMLTTEVENFPGFVEPTTGFQLVDDMANQSKRYGAAAAPVTVTKIVPDADGRGFTLECHGDDKNWPSVRARTVILATGAMAKYLGIPGEADFLNRGVSACATCDGAAPRFRKVPLVVVGGGDTAAEEALFLTRFASEVHVVHRRGVLRASKVMAKRLINNPKVVMQWNSVAKRVVGDADTGVTGVVVADAATGAERTIPASGYFSAIGHEPLSKLVKDLTDLDDAGYVVPHPELGGKTYTKVPGLFACGDVQDKVYRQAVTAAGSGCEAALDATRYLEALDA